MSWDQPNYIPESQDTGRTQYHPNYDAFLDDISDEPARSPRLLHSSGFKVFAVLGVLWGTFMCFEAYQSTLHPAPHVGRATNNITHKHPHQKD